MLSAVVNVSIFIACGYVLYRAIFKPLMPLFNKKLISGINGTKNPIMGFWGYLDTDIPIPEIDLLSPLKQYAYRMPHGRWGYFWITQNALGFTHYLRRYEVVVRIEGLSLYIGNCKVDQGFGSEAGVKPVGMPLDLNSKNTLRVFAKQIEKNTFKGENKEDSEVGIKANSRLTRKWLRNERAVRNLLLALGARLLEKEYDDSRSKIFDKISR